MSKLLRSLAPLLVIFAIVLTACGQGTPAAAPTAAPAATSAPAPEATAAPAAPTSAPAAEPTAAPAAPEPTAAPAANATPTDIELWAGASVSEAGPPPDDWAAY